ncbi:hypothetical protein G4Y79_15205 [Phototrophicus methaneseepsis]|uniref:Uncharacterized protein n=1 Tax=Phototrophicus methaneseepsis TaxID=2710758 RepID=A0A7S8E648_9CHLR|nr:hypothetical protein [Phototrophicus methaneseepsis]QPC81050.1 hypothetical protein G4Y79_15205 [Phototrophicus methaneseepsis]
MSNFDRFKKTAGIHGMIASDIAHFGGVLRCKECGKEQPLTEQQISHYLGHGWPECHGETMLWVTQRQLDAGE